MVHFVLKEMINTPFRIDPLRLKCGTDRVTESRISETKAKNQRGRGKKELFPSPDAPKQS